jgi:nucleoside phosphorylase
MRLATSAFRGKKTRAEHAAKRPRKSPRVAVVAAFEPELRAFREALPEVSARAVGIGLVDAAIGTAAVIAGETPDVVIAIGTCGAFGARAGNGIVVASEAMLVDVADVMKFAALPDATATREAMTETFGAKRELGIVATTLGVTVDDGAASAIAKKTGARAEHMEAFAIARACALANVRCGIVLGVANRVGSSGRAEWRANHVDASARAAAFVASWLVRLSRGVRT